MKLLIEIPEEDYERVMNENVSYNGSMHTAKAIKNGTPIPDNATNGDVINAMFPSIESRLDEKTGIMLVKWADGTAKAFKTDWWDAPYKAESGE